MFDWFRRNKKSQKLREADSYISEQKTRHRKRRTFLLINFGVLCAGLIAIGAGWLVLHSQAFQIKEWKVNGNNFTNTDAIRNFLDIKVLTASLSNTVLGFQNIIAWPETSFDNHAAELPRVKKLSIEKQYLKRTISVSVEERVPFGIWCDGPTVRSTPAAKKVSAPAVSTSTAENGSSTVPVVPVEPEAPTAAPTTAAPICFWFDTDGVLLDSAPYASGNLIPVVHDYSGKYLRSQTKVHDAEAIKNLISVFDAVHTAGLSIREVRLEDRELQEVKVVLSRGPTLLFSLRFAASEAVPVIASLQRNGGGANPYFSELEYVDFRVEHRAYYK